MTIVTVSEAGLVELPEDVRKQFNLCGPDPARGGRRG